MDNILTSYLYGGLIKQSKKTQRKQRRMTASTIANCRRANWYAIRLVVKENFEPDPVLLSKFRDGNKAHDGIGELLAEAGLPLLATEFDVYCGTIYARVDALTRVPELGEVNIEFKTMAASSFFTFVRYGIIAFSGYYTQCQVILGSEPRRPLILWAKNKNTSEYNDELVEPDEVFIANLKQRKEAFDVDLDKNYPPKREYSYSSPACKVCDFRFKCWFSTIMRQTLLPANLSSNEVRVIDKLMFKLNTFVDTYDEYCNFDRVLRDYVAMLHSKHSVDSIKLPGITSSLISSTKEHINADYVKSILTDEEYELAFYSDTSKYFRTQINLIGGADKK